MRSTPCLSLASHVLALAAACGDGESVAPSTSTAATSTGTGGAGDGGGTTAGGAGGATTTSAGGAPSTIHESGGSSQVSLRMPQLVRGAGYVDRQAFPQATLVVEPIVPGITSVVVYIQGAPADGKPSTEPPVEHDGDRFLAHIDASALAPGAYHVQVSGFVDGTDVDNEMVTLVVGDGSVQWTKFDDVGPAAPAGLVHDADGDRLALTWWSVAGGDHHRAWLSYLDGGLRRIAKDDVVLSEPEDDALGALTTFTKDAIGVVYRTPKPDDGHWLVKMRIVDHDGNVVVPAMDLTAGESAFVPVQIGQDPGGISAAWLHIPPPVSPKGPQKPLEIRFARWDVAAQKLAPVTIDAEQPAPDGSQQGPLAIPTLAELGVACNTAVCVVSYSREVYSSFVDLNIPKLFLGVVDLKTGALASAPVPVEAADWDTQMFGHHLVALADGTFVLVYTANDTAAAMKPKSACDDTMERDLLYAVKLDENGAMVGAPKPIFDFEGTRQMPRLAPHPAGFALFWEDQRSECQKNGHIAMAMNVAAPDLGSLLDPYLEAPASRTLAPEAPALSVVGTNFAHAWSDNRHGNGLLDMRPEVYVDTYWRK